MLLVLAAGARLSAYIGATVGEIGFLRGFWMDGSRRLAWLEDYAASVAASGDLPVPAVLHRGIRFDHVSFTYPGTSRVVLDDVSRDAARGRGGRHRRRERRRQNDARQTARQDVRAVFRVHLRGRHSACAHARDEWRARLAGAFQDFFRFEFRAATPSAWATSPGSTTNPPSSPPSTRAGAGDVIARLTSGLDTQLGPTWPGGVELSFGQWQKLALARGFMRDQPLLLVLDEPTAALDAETEHALFERYAAAARGSSPAAAAAASPSSFPTASPPSAWPI